MTPRHAAALTLVGWYLMVPPLRIEGPTSDPNAPVVADTNAPLAKWKIIGDEFDTLKKCQDYPAHLAKLLHDTKGPEKETKDADAVSAYWFSKAQLHRDRRSSLGKVRHK